MNHLQNHIDNYLVHCQTQKRLDAKTLKAYRDLSIPLKINIRMNGIIRDIRTNMFYR